jgi:hypothetical protein
MWNASLSAVVAFFGQRPQPLQTLVASHDKMRRLKGGDACIGHVENPRGGGSADKLMVCGSLFGIPRRTA